MQHPYPDVIDDRGLAGGQRDHLRVRVALVIRNPDLGGAAAVGSLDALMPSLHDSDLRNEAAELKQIYTGGAATLAPAEYCSADGTPFITGRSRMSVDLLSNIRPF